MPFSASFSRWQNSDEAKPSFISGRLYDVASLTQQVLV